MQAYRRVYNLLRGAILGGRYRVGQILPAETELSRRHNLSRITIRHALRLLQEEGLVTRQAGRGTFVRKLEPRKIPILNADFASSMRRGAPGLVRRLRTCQVAAPNHYVADMLGLPCDARCLVARRLDVLDGTPVAFDRVCIPESLAGGVDRGILKRVDFLDVWLRRAGIEAHRTTQSIEAVEADRETVVALGVRLRSPMLLVTETLYAEDGRALAVVESVFPGDRYKMVATLGREGRRPGRGGKG